MRTLRDHRVSQFTTQEELAKKAGLSPTTVNRLEKGREKPMFQTIRKLAEALGVSPDQIDFK